MNTTEHTYKETGTDKYGHTTWTCSCKRGFGAGPDPKEAFERHLRREGVTTTTKEN